MGFGEFSIDIEIFANVRTTNWTDFLAIAEDINLATVNVLERTGAKLAEPPR
jgi:MscS family membrane protein